MLWATQTQAAQTILIFGDSLSAAYGMATEQSWPALLQDELKKRKLPYRIHNASISGETALGGRQRIERILREQPPAIVILELGANDGLRGASTVDIAGNLRAIIRASKRAKAQAMLIGMRLPPNYGEAYVTQFADIYARLAKEEHLRFVPFLLEGVPDEYFQADHLHPTAEGQPQIFENVLKGLQPLLR